MIGLAFASLMVFVGFEVPPLSNSAGTENTGLGNVLVRSESCGRPIDSNPELVDLVVGVNIGLETLITS
jgi:hypothetical protein